MEITDIDLKNLTDKGFIIKRNILNEEVINRSKKIILINRPGKGGVETSYPSNNKQLIIKNL